MNKWLIDKRLDTHDFESYVNPVILKFSKVIIKKLRKKIINGNIVPVFHNLRQM